MRTFLSIGIVLATGLVIWADEELPPEPATEPVLVLSLAEQRAATVADAYLVFAMLARDQGHLDADVAVEQLSYDQLRGYMLQLCLISGKWEYCGNECLRRDVLSFMAAKYLGCRPGILTGLFGMTRRYANREMQFRKIVAPGSPKTIVSGSELLSVVTRIAICTQPHQNVELTADEIH